MYLLVEDTLLYFISMHVCVCMYVRTCVWYGFVCASLFHEYHQSVKQLTAFVLVKLLELLHVNEHYTTDVIWDLDGKLMRKIHG